MLPRKPLSPSTTLALDNRTSFAAESDVARYRFVLLLAIRLVNTIRTKTSAGT